MITDVVCHLLDVLVKPLNKAIDQIILESQDPHDTLLKPFIHSSTWMVCEPYCDMSFEYEHIAFNFVALCNIFELFYGVTAEHCFSDELTTQVKEMVEVRLSACRTHEFPDQQLNFNHEAEEGMLV